MDRYPVPANVWLVRHAATLLLMAADAAAALGALLLACYTQSGIAASPNLMSRLAGHDIALWSGVLAYVAVFFSYGLYRQVWRFAGLETLGRFLGAAILAALALVCVQVVPGGVVLTQTALAVFILASMGATGALRLVLRWVAVRGDRPAAPPNCARRRRQRPTRVLILGDGADTARLLSALRQTYGSTYRVIGLLHDNPKYHGMVCHGVRMLGPLRRLGYLLTNRMVDEVLVAARVLAAEPLREYMAVCRRAQVRLKVIPMASEAPQVVPGQRKPEVDPEVLFDRQTPDLDPSVVGKYVADRCVLVTGAGGTVGAELCRQLLAFHPTCLVLYGHGEYALRRAYRELVRHDPALARCCRLVVGSVTDDVRLEQIFSQYRPHVVFHAAAHTHEPVTGDNVPEVIQNNVMGTRCVAEVCGRFGVERMVLISTIAAAQPAALTAATKWLSEEVVRLTSRNYGMTSFVTVRCGHVLGGQGGLLGVLQEQIRHGGPVTVAHPEATRYFMAVTDAARLALQACAVGRSGEIFLPDMGRPVRVIDLAHDVIRLSGLEPDVDIPIAFAGLDAGEMLYERLCGDDELLLPGVRAGLSVLQRSQHFSPAEFRGLCRRLQVLAVNNATDELLDVLASVVPGFPRREPCPQADGNSMVSDARQARSGGSVSMPYRPAA